MNLPRVARASIEIKNMANQWQAVTITIKKKNDNSANVIEIAIDMSISKTFYAPVCTH